MSCVYNRDPRVLEPLSFSHLFQISRSPVCLQETHPGNWLLVDRERALGASCLGCGFLPQSSLLFPVRNVPEACAVVPRVSREQWERQQAGAITVRQSGFPLLLSQCLIWLSQCETALSCHHKDTVQGVRSPGFSFWLSLPYPLLSSLWASLSTSVE